MNYTISKFPIVMFTTPRTGGNHFATFLGIKHNLKIFLEPEIHDLDSFFSYSKNNNNYILKVHAERLTSYPASILSEYSYKIRLRRRNLIEQHASNYVARKQNVWAYTTDDLHTYKININHAELVKSMLTLKHYNQQLENLSIDYDLDLFYEDLPNVTSTFKITPKPTNYNELLDVIAAELKKGL